MKMRLTLLNRMFCKQGKDYPLATKLFTYFLCIRLIWLFCYQVTRATFYLFKGANYFKNVKKARKKDVQKNEVVQ